MSYCIARITPEGITAIRHFETYSEADEWFDHYSEIYCNSIVEIFPSGVVENEPQSFDPEPYHV
jgi:hypothetical protein